MPLRTKRVAAALAAAAFAAVAGTGCGIYHHAQAGQRQQEQAERVRIAAAVKAAARPMTRAEKCVVVVSRKLAQVPDALAQGYMGVDANDLMVQYGTSSPEFMTFEQAQGQMIGDIQTYGAAGSLQRILLAVRKGCRQTPVTVPN